MKYEESIKELENILSKLEDPSVSIDDAIEAFSKSVELSKDCFDFLNQAEGKVEIIKKQLDEVVKKPFTDIEN